MSTGPVCQMRVIRLLIILLFSLPLWAVDSTGEHPVVNIYMLRTGEQLQNPHVVTYRFFEWTQIRGRWIVPDIGYLDTGYGKDQIWFAGGGAYILQRPHLDWYQEIYVTQEAGEQSTNKRSLWIWPVLDARFRPRLIGQLAAYPTIPLDQAQRWGMDVDRAKIEWLATPHWNTGAGYSGVIDDARSWQNKPFLSVTRKTRAGDFEFWLQRLPAGGQVQARYTFVDDRR
jgi:hypothetical protein